MIFLLQILNMIKPDQLEDFQELFSDLSEHSDHGCTKEEYCNDLLKLHFGLSFDDPWQLKMFTEVIQKQKLFKSAVNITRLRAA